MNRILAAQKAMQNGCACSQAILTTYGEALGLSSDTALRISAGFGAGMGIGSVCGAVTGALMVLGLEYPSDTCRTGEGRRSLYPHIRKFTALFQEKNGSVQCRELLGCDIGTPEGMQRAREEKLFETVCVKMVEDAAAILETIRKELRQTASFPD